VRFGRSVGLRGDYCSKTRLNSKKNPQNKEVIYRGGFFYTRFFDIFNFSILIHRRRCYLLVVKNMVFSLNLKTL